MRRWHEKRENHSFSFNFDENKRLSLLKKDEFYEKSMISTKHRWFSWTTDAFLKNWWFSWRSDDLHEKINDSCFKTFFKQFVLDAARWPASELVCWFKKRFWTFFLVNWGIKLIVSMLGWSAIFCGVRKQTVQARCCIADVFLPMSSEAEVRTVIWRRRACWRNEPKAFVR